MGTQNTSRLRRHAKADDLSEWTYRAYLEQPDFDLNVPEIEKAVQYQDNVAISEHPFFRIAAHYPPALKTWAEQEMITSSCFSQVITEWMATIDNCHIRTKVLPVFAGEHGNMYGNIASQSHPYLAEQLCRSLNSDLDSIVVLEPTRQFIADMEDSAASQLGGAGFLGIGNERMLLEEYGAVRAAYSRACPTAHYREFLEANIFDDAVHHRIIAQAAAAMVSLGGDPAEFYIHAKKGVDSRMIYYDELVNLLDSGT
jgi:hypothetical protein